MFGGSDQIEESLIRLERASKSICLILKNLFAVFAVAWIAFIVVSVGSTIITAQDGAEILGGLALLSPSLATIAVSAYIFYVVIGVFDSIRKGSSPFTMRTAKQIRIVSFLFVVIFFLCLIISVAPIEKYSLGIMSVGISGKEDGVVASLNVSALIAAAIGFGLSYVFKYGALLQQLTDDTI